ncbi:MAG: tRNA lysidine(34) synthetase TilS, partial [Dehalococcoidia bacterium]
YKTCLVTRGALDSCPFPPLEGEHRLNLGGETILPGWRVKSAIAPCPPSLPTSDDFRAYLDLDETGEKLLVRGRRAGDRFQPLGMEQPKKLHDFMIDAKIPRAWRDHVPLVCSPEQILWVVGWRIAEPTKVKDATGQVLLLEFQRL